MSTLKSRQAISRQRARRKMEEIHGKISRTHVVHHVDENPLNNDIANLCIMERGEHAKHHCKKSEPPQKACPRITFCLPQRMKTQLAEYSKETGISKAELLRQMIREFFERSAK